jgi:hypothetical protein
VAANGRHVVCGYGHAALMSETAAADLSFALRPLGTRRTHPRPCPLWVTATFRQRRTNVWRKATNPTWEAKRQRGGTTTRRLVAGLGGVRLVASYGRQSA